MIDRLKYQPDRLYLCDEAVDRTSTIEGFGRMVNTEGRTVGGTIVLRFRVARYPILCITAIKVRDGRWWVKWVTANLPALLHGHNGWPLADARELYLALTRLRHIVTRVVAPEGHPRIIPGTGNKGWLREVECFRQIVDEDHRVLIASHFARLDHQQRPTRVYFGESSKFHTRPLELSIYDKGKEMTYGLPVPEGINATRLEAIFRNEDSLVKAAKATREYSGAPGPVVSTLAPDTALAMVDRALARLSGFGWMAEFTELPQLCKSARIIAAALGDAIHEPHRLELALEHYLEAVRPGVVTAKNVGKQLRAYSASTHMNHSARSAVIHIGSLPVAQVRWSQREMEFAVLMRDIGAPDEPEPDIVMAWSQTTFLREVPAACELIGAVNPTPPPFRTNTL
jgi:hypothetical protein